MIISRISRLHDCGIFREFTWPQDLPEFGRYNLIYGWNGSGKTTLSRVFRALEMRTVPPIGQVTLSIDGKDVTGDEFTQLALPVRVFNRDFVMESVFPVGGGEMPPIFVVGRENVEKQKIVDQLKRDLANTRAALESARSKKQEAARALDRYCVDRATVIRDTLRSPGSNPYNNYNKSHFRARAQKMVTDGDKEIHRLNESDLARFLAQHRAIQKPKIREVTYRLPELKELAAETSRLLATTVVSAAIDSLKDDATLSEWIHQGLGLHQARDAKKCLFCEQTLPEGRLAALEGHFNNEYEEFLKRLDAQIAQLKEAKNTCATVALPNSAEFYEDLAGEYEAAAAAVRRALELTRTFLELLTKALMDKRGRVFESLRLDADVPDVDAGVIERLNEVIRKHNRACEEFATRVRDARQRLEAHFVAESLDEFVKLTEAVRAAEGALNEADAKVRRLALEIERLERDIIEHRQPAEELNDELRKYLGHDELRLETKDTGYIITRNGEPAYALSEGEMTAIALLYFLKSLNDRRFDLSRGVVVLDDPVSSLDANALYLAFGFIRQRTEGAGQLFILTHNFSFFRQVRNWFSHLKGQNRKDVTKRPARFYMLDCAFYQGKRYATIRALHPLLEKYESEYHYLFYRIFREARGLTRSGLEENYVLPNMARRLLEAFLAFRHPHISGNLWEQLQSVQFDEAKKLRIYRFLHTYSHSDAIVEPEHDPVLLGEARSVLADLLDLMRSVDSAHYSAMETLMRNLLVAASNGEEAEVTKVGVAEAVGD